MAPPIDIELQLQRHGTALRRLAFDLLRDSSDVDDAVQETWLRAVRWPPRDTHGVGRWLATALPIEFRSANSTVWSAPVQMPSDRAETEVTVVLPDPPK